MSLRRELEAEAARAAWVSTGCQGDFAAGWDLGVNYGRAGELEAMRKRLEELERDNQELDEALTDARAELDPGVL